MQRPITSLVLFVIIMGILFRLCGWQSERLVDQYADVKKRIAAGADPNAYIKNGWTPVEWAIRMSDTGFLHQLVEKGACVNLRDRTGRAPICVAAGMPAPVLEAVLNEGADPNYPDADGTSAVSCAARAGNVENLNLLLNRGADPGEADNTGIITEQSDSKDTQRPHTVKH